MLSGYIDELAILVLQESLETTVLLTPIVDKFSTAGSFVTITLF